MNKLLSILLLLSASTASASVQPFEDDEVAMLHPVQATENQLEAGPALQRSCGEPVVLFRRAADGHLVFIGVVQPKESC